MSFKKLSEKEFFKFLNEYSLSFNLDGLELQSDVTLNLWPEQHKLVKWMINRENNNDLIKNDESPFSGGILADVINLDQIIAILCCIKSNPSRPEFSHKNNSVENDSNDIKNFDKPPLIRSIEKKKFTSIFDDDIVGCYCKETPTTTTIINCTTCDKSQHAQCIRFDLMLNQDIPYFCTECLKKNKIYIQCKATLLIIPQLIFNQLIDKIEKTIIKLGLKVFIYSSMYFDGYIYPYFFNDFDVVIISSSNLSRDLSNKVIYDIEQIFIDNHNYQSPLFHLKWWRICFADGQFSDLVHTEKHYKIIQSLQSTHKWIIPSTLEKSDIFGNIFDFHKIFLIFEALNVKPYCDEITFVNQKTNSFYSKFIFEWCSKIIYSIKTNLKLKHNYLAVSEIRHEIELTGIEKSLYIFQHNKFCDRIQDMIHSANETQNSTIIQYNQGKFNHIMKTLHEFQFNTSHPKNEMLQFITTDSMTTIQNLYDVLIKKKKQICNDLFKQILTNKICFCLQYFISSDDLHPIIKYMDSFISLIEDYWHVIDMNQINNIICDFIILYHKHEQRLYTCDIQLRARIDKLEEKYICIDKKIITSNFEITTNHSNIIDELIGEESLNWWNQMQITNWNLSSKDFLAEVEEELDYYVIHPELNIAHELNSINDVYNVINIWLIDIDVKRKEIISIFKKLKEISIVDLVQSALKCHIHLKHNPSETSVLKNKSCLLCEAEIKLVIYSKLLFSSSVINEELMIDVVYEIIQINIPNTEPHVNQMEILLSKLIQYGQTANTDFSPAANEYLHILKLQRIEYKCFKFLLFQLKNIVLSHSKIIEAKLMENYEEFKFEETAPYIDINISLDELISDDEYKIRFETQILFYIQELKEERDKSTEIIKCPICYESYTFALLPCGHYVCCECLLELCDREFGCVLCPICRRYHYSCSSFLLFAINNEETSDTFKGHYSVKMKCITMELKRLISEDSSIKILIFSSNNKLLDILGYALKENSVNYRILKPTNFKSTLREFNIDKQINALLMNLNYNSMDIDLTVATRVFLMEPNIYKENDLINVTHLINRKEQTKPIFIHRFINKSTIDEIIPLVFDEGLDNITDLHILKRISEEIFYK